MPGLDEKLRAELEDLYALYAERLDEGPLDAWPELFLADASYRVVTRENVERGMPLALLSCDSRAAIEDRIYAVANTSFTVPRRTRHLVAGIRCPEPLATPLQVEANFAVYESLHDEMSRVHSVGRYRDRVARDAEGRLRFLEKVCIVDSGLVPNSLVIPL
jgi:3-phenylpropionate/cinnamic acid dioxygenase small subunit